MADKTVSLKLEVDAQGAGQSVSDLKKSIIDLKNQALKVGEDTPLGRQFIKDAGAAKDRLSDLNKQVDAFQDAGAKFGAVTKLVGSLAGGFQAAQGAAALFGASGEDLQKVLVKVQAATALAQGAQALAGITDEIGAVKKIALATASGIAGAAARLFGITTAQAMAVATAGLTVVIGAVVALISYFASAGDASEELAKKEEKRKDKAKKDGEYLTQLQQRDLDNAQLKIELLKKEGAAEEKIIQAQNELLNLKIKNNKAQQDLQDTTDEGQKKFEELVTEAKKLKNEETLLNTKEVSKKEVAVKVETNKKLLKTDEQLFEEAEKLKKKQADDFAALTEKEYSDSIKNTSEYYDHLIALAKLNNEDTTALENKKAEELIVIGDDYGQKTLAQQDALNLEKKKQKEDAAKKEVDDAVKLAQENLSGGVGGSELANQIALENALYEQAKIANTNLEQLEREHIAKIEGLKKASALKSVQAGLKMAQDSISAIQNITDIAYIVKLSRVKKGSKEEEVILRKQFETNKKMQIASAIINGALAITNIIATVPKADFGIATAVMLVASASATAASIAKIASTKFEGGGGGGSVDIPNITAPPETSAPSIQNQSLLGNDQSTQAGTKVFVTESDIKKVTGRVSVIENQARFG